MPISLAIHRTLARTRRPSIPRPGCGTIDCFEDGRSRTPAGSCMPLVCQTYEPVFEQEASKPFNANVVGINRQRLRQRAVRSAVAVSFKNETVNPAAGTVKEQSACRQNVGTKCAISVFERTNIPSPEPGVATPLRGRSVGTQPFSEVECIVPMDLNDWQTTWVAGHAHSAKEPRDRLLCQLVPLLLAPRLVGNTSGDSSLRGQLGVMCSTSLSVGFRESVVVGHRVSVPIRSSSGY